MKRHVFHQEASNEYTQAVEYYAAIDPALGNRLYDEIERLVLEIRQQPDRFSRIGPMARRFPYAVVYLDQPDRVRIVPMMHAKRRPGYWKSRL